MTATVDIEPLYGLTLVESPITGYHGSCGNREFEADKFKGVWFAEDKDAEILNYYATRDNQRTVIEAEIHLGRNIDLSMYNADEKCNADYAGSFLRDTGLPEQKVNAYLGVFFDDFAAMDYDDDGEPVLAISVMLNRLIELEFLPSQLCDSITIKEANDDLTHCILRLDNIRVKDVVS